MKRRRGRKSALGVIKATAVWLRRLEFECVMCRVNDPAAAAGTGSSRCLRHLIALVADHSYG